MLKYTSDIPRFSNRIRASPHAHGIIIFDASLFNCYLEALFPHLNIAKFPIHDST